jgi:hypothetical protein
LFELQLTALPSTENATPITTPAGVAPAPWFLTTAEKVTACPATGAAGLMLMDCTTISGKAGAADATEIDFESVLLDVLLSANLFWSFTLASTE